MGAPVLICTDPLDEFDDSFPAASVVFTLKYHVPSVSGVVWVKLFVVEVLLDTPEAKLDDCDHCTVYGVAASPLVASVLAVHVHVGVVSAVGEVVDGVPGVEGAVTSIVNVSVVTLPFAVVFPFESVARTLMVCDPSEREPAVQLNASLAELKVPSVAVQLLHDPAVLSI